MRDFFTVLFLFTAAALLWRTVRPHRNRPPHVNQIAPTQPLRTPDAPARCTYKWPVRGLFQLSAAGCSRYQAALKLVADGTPISPWGSQVLAQLRTGSNNSEIWNLVEIWVHGRKVGFLSSGDASRFRHRLAYEGHAGQTTSCEALITLSGNHYGIRLDLKEFRH